MVNVALTITTKEEVGVFQGYLSIRFQYFLCKPLCGHRHRGFKHRA